MPLIKVRQHDNSYMLAKFKRQFKYDVEMVTLARNELFYSSECGIKGRVLGRQDSLWSAFPPLGAVVEELNIAFLRWSAQHSRWPAGIAAGDWGNEIDRKHPARQPAH